MTHEDGNGADGDRPRSSTLRANLASAIAAVLVVAVGIVGLMWFARTSDSTPPSSADEETTETTQRPQRSDEVEPASLSELTESTTHTRLEDPPDDPDPSARTDGKIVRPKQMIPIHAEPRAGGGRVGKVGPDQIGETWLPVVGRTDGWVQVLLPSKPNSSVGWLEADQVTEKVTPYVISVHLGSMRMQLFKEDREIGNWEIGIGKPDTPTPTGRTFLLGSIVDPAQDYSPIILPLGSHSATLDTFGGGPGTVAIHTWPKPQDVLGKANSHGCIRVSQEALNELTEVPLGTLVLVDEQ